MGCTSSAPNMVNSSTAEKSIQFEEMNDDQSKDTEEIIYKAGNDTNEINVLPSCDTLADPIHVVRNKSTSSLKTEKDNNEDNESSEIIKKTNSSSSLKGEEKVAKLEEVVQKVVELYSTEKEKDTHPVFKIAEETQKNEVNNDKDHVNETKVLQDDDAHIEMTITEEKEQLEQQQETSSPSQSENSRATRWEALADIAAELPPSLTVDPITGQIFSVTK